MIQKLSSALFGLLVLGSMVGCGGDSGSNTQETLSSSQPTITLQEKINPDFLEWQKQQENNKLNKSDSNPLSTNGYIPPLHKPTVHNPKNDKQVVIRKVYDSSVSTSDSKFDYRDPNLDGNFSDSRLTPIKDQSNCGACWAFASYGALEGSLLQDENRSNDFSENNIKNGHGFLIDSCQGGNLDIASAYFARGNGPVFESEDEYNPNSTSSDYLLKPSARYVDNIIHLPVRSSTTDNAYLKQALLDHGPIYADINGAESNVYGNTIYNSEATGSNHAIVLVGWDDNYETEGQTGAFIIRNSWGTAYGEDGYFYVPYSDQTLAFQEVGYFDDIKDDETFNFDIIHDTAPNGAIVSYTIYSNTAPLYGMSVYNVEANQSIQAVGIFNNGEDTNISISFYKDVSFNGSILLNTETLSEQFGNLKKGWNTLQLQTPIDINTTYGKFAVKIQIQENGDNNATLPVDASYAGWSELTTEANQSFISTNGTEWNDLHNNNQSVAIKVFAQSIDINSSEDNTSNELLSLIWENIATGIEANLTAEQYNSVDGVDGAVTENEQAYQDYINSHPEMFTLETLAGDIQAMIDTVNAGWTDTPTFNYVSTGFLTPNGGENWYLDQNETISWDNAMIMGDNVRLYILQEESNATLTDLNLSTLLSTMNWYMFDDNASNIIVDYSINPRDLNFIGETRLLVVSNQTGDWDVSDNAFTISDVNTTLETNSSCEMLPTINDDSDFVDQVPNDLAWSATADSVLDIEMAFNSARALDPTVSVELQLPPQAEWDGMDIQSKALYILNRERYDRGIKPFEGISPAVISVANNYAELLYATSTFSHTEDGSPWERLDRVPEINASKDFFAFAENLSVSGGSSYTTNPMAKAIYNWIYKDSDSGWGHRNFCLATGLNDNSGVTGAEGLIGVGMITGENYNYSVFDGYKSTIIVLNGFDPSSTWNHDSTITESLCNTTVVDDNTTVVDDNTTVVDDNTTVVDDNTTVVDDNTTVVDDNTTVVDDNTTVVDDSNNMYGENASIIRGFVTLASDVNLTPASECFDSLDEQRPLAECNAVFIDLFNTNNEFLSSTMVQPDGNYTLYFQELEDTFPVNIKIHTKINGIEENFYRDFGTDHAISDDDYFQSERDVIWREDTTTGQWFPDVNYLNIVAPETELNLDLASKDNDKFILNGTVQVPADFIPGEIIDENGNWQGWNMLSLTAINMTTGEQYWTEISETEISSGSHRYPFNIKLPNTPADYIIRLEKMSDNNGISDWIEMYLDDEEAVITTDSDHIFNGNEVPVSAIGVEWKDNGNGVWTPDVNKTGYFTIDANIDNISIDISTYGTNFKKIEGIVTPPSDFNLNDSTNHIYIELIDAKTGSWLGNVAVNSDLSYSILLGDSTNGDNGYILKVNLEHWDQDDWQNSYWKSFYLDFTGTLTYNFKDESEVRWEESVDEATNISYWVPNVRPLIIQDSTTLDIDFTSYSVPETYEVTGTISGLPSSAKWVYVHLYDPMSYIGKGTELNSEDNSFKLKGLTAGKYIMNISYTDENDDYRYFDYLVVDDNGDFTTGATTIDSMEVKWIPYTTDGLAISNTLLNGSNFDWNTIAYWAPEETDNQKTILNLNGDINLGNLQIIQPVLANLITNLHNVGNGKSVSFNLFVPNEPIGKWDSNTSSSNGDVSIKISDLKARDDYQLQLWIEGRGEYWYDGTNNTLTSDVYWVGTQNDTVCYDWNSNPTIDNCDWNGFVSWEPNIDGFTINNDSTLDLDLPNDKSTLTALLALGNDYANKTFDVYIWQTGSSNNYAWDRFSADSNGDVNVTLAVKNGSNYIMEIYDTETWNGFTVDTGIGTQNSGDESLILAQNSWSLDSNGMWNPKASILIDMNSDLDLGTLLPPVLNTVTFTVNGLATDSTGNITEDVWIALEDTSNKAWYAGGNGDWSDWRNPIFSNTLSIEVPNTGSSYEIYLYTSEHESGLIDIDGTGKGVIDTSATINFADNSAQVTWYSSDADTVAILNDTNISITLKALNDYKSIRGLVTLGAGDIEAGWMCATSQTDTKGNCGEVDANGVYSIAGLSPSNNDVYSVQYWANTGETFNVVETWADASTDLTVDMNIESATKITITGTVTDSDTSTTPVETVLLDVNGTNWKVLDAQELNITTVNTAVNFSFTDLAPEINGHHYEVAVASKDMNLTTGVTIYTVQNAVQKDGTTTTTTNITDDTTITISSSFN